ncbi:NADH-quinone oxidoreductase subunit K [Erythrobacter sp.]|uniref:NADH-quinone oxidoreductase subunit K n=1 Tax=Erythrobacter sp. TaxID=1042 RepID=UPI001B04ECF3|nr:NADH-quinone oxidoreductase subunit K [Erythrobacter sp.]MBO6528293.1 NADH-quinone oxidoreductase subunit K [Erythrobacter sp.]MBO6531361.1 NADH-quinone oxidoreductase subunit K [Erythrobacter sp.]
MSAATFFGLIGIGITALALYALLTAGEWLRRILAINVIGVGLFMMLVARAYRGPEVAPDAVPHALVLTGIVVAAAATGFALALARKLTEAEEAEAEVEKAEDDA